MLKLPLNVTFESLKMELIQILFAELLRMAVALALVAIAAYLYYNKKVETERYEYASSSLPVTNPKEVTSSYVLYFFFFFLAQ